jgi:hypothetical protein
MKNTNKEIVISNMMRAKNKQSFFALHQIQNKIKTLYPDVKVDFHILWDDTNEDNQKEEQKWSNLIDTHIEHLTSYSKDFFNNYVENIYGLNYIEKFNKYKAIYFVVMAHYLRRVLCKDYYMIYDDDILINDDFKHITDLMLNKTPVMISEPMNVNCDKVLAQKLVDTFGNEFGQIYTQRNPQFKGFNAGFQGIDLSIYDNFLSTDRFQMILDLFEYKTTFDENGKEIWGNDRFVIDTQQQSFFGLMNTVLSKKDPHILDDTKYYVIPNWGDHPTFGYLDHEDENNGWTWALKSNITHFIGHTQGKGKPKQFLERVNEYLINNKFEI